MNVSWLFSNQRGYDPSESADIDPHFVVGCRALGAGDGK
jgi:hypothetical protein